MPVPFVSSSAVSSSEKFYLLEGRAVRVDQYSMMHAVEEAKDGALFETHRFIKASGGCSAPPGSYDSKTLASIGEMKLRMLAARREAKAARRNF
jgi:hypothetical protein